MAGRYGNVPTNVTITATKALSGRTQDACVRLGALAGGRGFLSRVSKVKRELLSRRGGWQKDRNLLMPHGRFCAWWGKSCCKISVGLGTLTPLIRVRILVPESPD